MRKQALAAAGTGLGTLLLIAVLMAESGSARPGPTPDALTLDDGASATVGALAVHRAGAGPAPPTATVHAAAATDADPDPRGVHRPADGRDDDAALTAVVRRYCVACHNDAALTGNLSLQNFDVAEAPRMAEEAEKVIHKLRLHMMPPPDMPRPVGDTLELLVETLEQKMDEAAAQRPAPVGRTFQRLNRSEYTAAIRELLGIEIDAGRFLPLDTMSDNFDNIADVQALSATLLDGYLRAAAEISRAAIGNPRATPSEETYTVPRTASQMEHVEGAPYGTRGGLSVLHTFPADGEYVFRVSFYHETTGSFVGGNARGEQMEFSIDGERVALLEIDRWMHASDPNAVMMETEPVRIRAGQRRVSAAFISPEFLEVTQDLISPLGWSLASTAIAGTYGFTLLPHLRDLVISGPWSVEGVSETPARERLFTCRPEEGDDAAPCAREILSRLGTQAYRRPLGERDLEDFMAFYEMGEADGGFDAGIRMALEAILASPEFIFRLEPAPPDLQPGEGYEVGDVKLASRLSFFLWAGPPDQELLDLAREGRLSDPEELDRQVDRMLEDPRAESLATRFAAQWLRLQDLDVIQPDVRRYPDFDEQLRASMRRETELFFHHLVQEDRSILDLFTADDTFIDERLARHYGIPGVAGTHFRRVTHPDDRRQGLLGHASILTLTSHGSRTSAVDRGKWVMEVFLNSPPPPPPPGVPDLEVTPESSDDGRRLTVRQRMEQHRDNPACSSCHVMIDPIGLPLEYFDVTGRWRELDNGMPIDSRSELWDGTPVETPPQLIQALLQRPEPILRTFTRNLMAYALGRRVEPSDMARVREIIREAEAQDHRITAYIRGVVHSPAFRMQALEVTAEDANDVDGTNPQ